MTDLDVPLIDGYYGPPLVRTGSWKRVTGLPIAAGQSNNFTPIAVDDFFRQSEPGPHQNSEATEASHETGQPCVVCSGRRQRMLRCHLHPETFVTRLTDTQILILTSAASRPGMLAMPLPKGLHGAAAKKVVTLMTERGLIEEVEADLRRKEPLWRETGDGRGTTLIATEDGLAAIGIEPVVSQAMAGLRKSSWEPQEPAPVNLRKGTKQAELIALLRTPDGASILEITSVTGWQAHTVRGAISGTLGKKLGLIVASTKEEGRGRVYLISPAK